MVELIRPVKRDSYGPFGVVVEKHDPDGRPSIKAKMLSGEERWFLPEEVEEVTPDNLYEAGPGGERRIGFVYR